MKSCLNTFLLILFSFIVAAQKPDNVLARVRHTYTNKSDTIKNGKPRNENMLLFIGKNASLFASYDEIKQRYPKNKI